MLVPQYGFDTIPVRVCERCFQADQTQTFRREQIDGMEDLIRLTNNLQLLIQLANSESSAVTAMPSAQINDLKFTPFCKNYHNTIRFANANNAADDDVECTICLECIEDGQECLVLKCRHVFHSACIKLQLERRRKCPNCNSCDV